MKTKITPAMASEMLANNPINRRVSKQLVDRYARDMTEGRWKFNGQAIIVADTGKLIDGQHRLMACVKAKKSFEAVLFKGLPEDIMDTIDAGRKRSAGDIIYIKGMAEGYAPVVAASSRLILNYVRGDSLQNSQSTSAVMELISRYPAVIEKAIMAHPANKIVQTSALGAVMFLGTRAPTFDKRAEAFVKALTSGADLRNDDPRLALRNAFMNARARNTGGRAPLTMWAFMSTAIAWNAFVRQEPLVRIKMQPNESGRIIPPDVLGGPRRGDGLDALANVKVHTNQLKAIANREANAEAVA